MAHDKHDSGFLIRVGTALDSLARQRPPTRDPLRVAAVQTCWHPDPAEHRAVLAAGVTAAAAHGARMVCLQELTLGPYFATVPDHPHAAEYAENIPEGPTTRFAAELADKHGILVHASLYERGQRDLGFNTAICVAPDGTLLARTRKTHIPAFPGYHENEYFAPGNSGYPVIDAAGSTFGFPTCWDQWFPEVARAYALGGAEVLVYPTAIGSEPELPAFDTQPLWQHMITANGLANATFMVAINRIGHEDGISFYGSSFISDPYGRILVQAPPDHDTVLLADLDLDQRADWLAFGILQTRRPDAYTALIQPNPALPNHWR